MVLYAQPEPLARGGDPARHADGQLYQSYIRKTRSTGQATGNHSSVGRCHSVVRTASLGALPYGLGLAHTHFLSYNPDLRGEYASPVARSRNVQASSNGGFFCLSRPRGTPSTVGLLTIQRNIAGIRACQACSRYHCPIRAISIFSFLHPTSHEENHEFIAGDRARIRAARLRPSWQRPQPQHPHTRSAEKKSRSLSKSTDCSA